MLSFPTQAVQEKVRRLFQPFSHCLEARLSQEGGRKSQGPMAEMPSWKGAPGSEATKAKMDYFKLAHTGSAKKAALRGWKMLK